MTRAVTDEKMGLIAYFIHDSLLDDHDTLYRARILVSIVLIYTIVLAVVAFGLSISKTIFEDSAQMGIGLCSSISIAYILLLFDLKFTGHLEACSHIIVFAAIAIVCLGIFFTGGPSQGIASPLLAVPPIMSACLLGKKGGIIWTTVSMTCFLVLAGLEYCNVPFANSVDPNFENETRLIVIVIGYIAIIPLVFVYEAITIRLRKERDEEHERYIYLASHDELTSLPNRTKFKDNLGQTIRNKERRQPSQQIALAFLDLDGFKPINDLYGHHAGDEVLKHISLRIKQSLRETDMVARQGGDEFSILWDHIQSEDDIAALAEKITQLVSLPIAIEKQIVQVTGSLGIALYPKHSDNIDELWKFADIAMYQSKKDKNSWTLYSPSLLNRLDKI